jgi:hypothetical protein
MAFYYTLRIEVALRGMALPTADEIWNAFDHVPLANGAQWVGPLAKITREYYVFHPNKTKIIRVLSVEGPYLEPGARQVAQQVAQAVAAALKSISIPDVDYQWSDIVVDPYYAPNDGPLPAWQHGNASVPQLVENLPNGTGEIVESGLNRLRGGLGLDLGLGSAATSIQNSIASVTKWLAIGAGLVVLVVVLPRILPARRNPTKRLTNLRRVAGQIEGHREWERGAGRAYEGHYDIILLADAAGLSPEQTERVILHQNKGFCRELGLHYAKIVEASGRRSLRYMRED